MQNIKNQIIFKYSTFFNVNKSVLNALNVNGDKEISTFLYVQAATSAVSICPSSINRNIKIEALIVYNVVKRLPRK